VEASGESLTINGQAVQRQRVRKADGKTVYREQIGDVSYEVAFDPSPRYRPPDVSVMVHPTSSSSWATIGSTPATADTLGRFHSVRLLERSCEYEAA